MAPKCTYVHLNSPPPPSQLPCYDWVPQTRRSGLPRAFPKPSGLVWPTQIIIFLQRRRKHTTETFPAPDKSYRFSTELRSASTCNLPRQLGSTPITHLPRTATTPNQLGALCIIRPDLANQFGQNENKSSIPLNFSP